MHENSNNSQSKSILIVGASQGIGRTTAGMLAKEGYRLLLCSRTEDKLESLRADLQGEGHEIFALDASSEDDSKNLYKALKEKETKLDGIIFTAGKHSVKPLRIATRKDFEEMLESNLYTVTALLPKLLKLLNRGASIVLMGSAATVRAGSAVSPYIAAKSALEGVTRSWALELAPKAIRVNIIMAGVVTTETTNLFFNRVGREAVKDMEKRHPLGLGKPEDIAGAISFLVSDKSKWMTGHSWIIDGGFSISDH